MYLSNFDFNLKEVEFQLRKPFKLIEEALIKLKSNKISVELNVGLFQGSNLQLSSDSQIMSALVDDLRTYYTNLEASELEFYRNVFV